METPPTPPAVIEPSKQVCLTIAELQALINAQVAIVAAKEATEHLQSQLTPPSSSKPQSDEH
jgi:hypothetical protein